MPDFGLTKAIGTAVRKGAKGAKVLRPVEKELLEKEAQAAAAKAAPVVPKPTLEVPPQSTLGPPVTPAPAVAAAPQTIAEALPPPTVIDEAVLSSQATKLSKANLGDFALEETHMPNFDTITTSDEIKAVVAQTAESNKTRIDEARRGVITNEQLQGLADDLDTSTDVILPILTRESGGALNAETILASRQVLNSSAERLKGLADKITLGQATDIEKVQFARQVQFHNEYQTQFMGARAEAGRALNAFRIPVGSDAAQAARISELIASSGGDIERIAKAMHLTSSVKGITQIAKQGLFRRSLGASMNLVNRNFVNGILSGPATHMVNIMGNGMFQTMNVAETAVAARLGRFLTGEEHVQVGEALAQLHGTLGATKDAYRLAARAMRTGQTLDSTLKFEGTNAGRGTLSYLPELDKPYLGRVIHGFDQVIDLPTRVLGAEDDLFKTLAYRGFVEKEALLHVQKQLDAGAITLADAEAAARAFMENTPEETAKAAEDWAREMTFQSPLGSQGQKAQLFLRSAPVLTLIAPFIRTPINIFKQAAYRSPMALFSQRFWADVAKGGRARDMALTRFAMGSGTAAVIANMVANGDVTGGGPQDPAARQLWQADGKRPYSFRVRNPVTKEVTYHSYARMEPIASVVGSVADATEILSYLNSDVDTLADEETQAYQAAGAIIAGIMNNTGNKTFMQGVADFMELTNDPTRSIKAYSNQMLASQVPYSALQRYVRTTQDPYLREAWTLLDKVKDNTPGLSKDLPMRLDLFGEPREKNSSTLLGTMSPIPESPEKYDYTVKEIVNVMKQTNIVPVTMPDKRVEGMRLNAKEYAELVRTSRRDVLIGGKNFKDTLESVIDSDVYQRAQPVMRAEILKKVQQNFDKVGRATLEQENPAFADRVANWRLRKEQIRFGE